MSETICRQLRGDLQVTRQRRRWETIWIIKDPIAFAHFLFSEQEYFVLTLLDGRRTLAQVRQEWMQRFKSDALSLSQLEALCQRLASDGLTMNRRVGEGTAQAARGKSIFRKSLAAAARNPLAIRLRGVNPELLLQALAPLGAVLFHPLVIAMNLLFALAVLVMMLGNVDDLAAKMPTISTLLSSTGIVWLMVSLAIIKILHELGHGLACRRYGGECTEIGILLLAFTPCLYCNVSDAWLFPSKAKRILVSAAGIYVEIILSAIFGLVWFWSEPGWLNAMAFNIVLICSINTILLNGNPLLRYDGYYILSDLTDVPNLGQRGSSAFRSVIMNPVNRRSVWDGPRWLAVYGGASFFYRCFVIFSILSGVYYLLKLYDMQILAWLVAALTLFGIFSGSIQQFKKSMTSDSKSFQLNIPGALLVTALFVAVPCFVFLAPLPAHVWSPAVVELSDPLYIYAPRDGEVISAAALDNDLSADSVIATLQDADLSMEIEQTRGAYRRRAEFLQQLQLRENNEPELAVQVHNVRNEVKKLNERQKLLERDLNEMTILAPCDGRLYPPPRREPPATEPDHALLWSGTPLEHKNRGCFVPRGELLAVLGDPSARSLVGYVSENDIRQIEIGAAVRVSFSQQPGQTYGGQVTQIVTEDVTITPREFVGDTSVDSVRDPIGIARPLQTPYRVVIQLDHMPDNAFVGSTANVRLRISNRTLASSIGAFFERLIKTEI